MIHAQQKPMIYKQPCILKDFCINRDGIDRINTMMMSEKTARINLQLCRDEKMTIVNEGWTTTDVLFVISTTLVIAFGGGVLIGSMN